RFRFWLRQRYYEATGAAASAAARKILQHFARRNLRASAMRLFRSEHHAAVPPPSPGQHVITLRFSGSDRPTPAELEANQSAEDHARKELGVVYELVEVGEPAMVDGLLRDLEIEERLDAMINQQIKRLLHVRGLKSISAALPSAPPKRLPASTKAAERTNVLNAAVGANIAQRTRCV